VGRSASSSGRLASWPGPTNESLQAILSQALLEMEFQVNDVVSQYELLQPQMRRERRGEFPKLLKSGHPELLSKWELYLILVAKFSFCRHA
jgi:hypothetical protein